MPRKRSDYDCSTGQTRVVSVKGDLVVRTSSAADRTYIDSQQKANSRAVGFIQSTVWDRYVFGGERGFVVFVCEKNGDRVGYLLLTPGMAFNRHAKIQQVVIQQDARRLEYGTMLIDAVRGFCEASGRSGVTLRCRVDLDSNMFWKALGFELYGMWSKGKKNHVGMSASNDICLWKMEFQSAVPSIFGQNKIVLGENAERC